MYSAELALGGFTEQQVRLWAGQDAVWPQGVEVEKLESLVTVKIRGGSSGKPNTSAERQAWATALPLLEKGIMQIGQMRGADQLEIADRLEELMRETIRRLGDNLDVDRFIPGAAPGQPGAGMMPGMPGPMGAPGAGGPAPMPPESVMPNPEEGMPSA